MSIALGWLSDFVRHDILLEVVKHKSRLGSVKLRKRMGISFEVVVLLLQRCFWVGVSHIYDLAPAMLVPCPSFCLAVSDRDTY